MGQINLNNGILNGGWVPTSHNFTIALGLYRNYRLIHPNPPATADFNQYIINMNEAVGGNLYVQNGNEFALNNQPIELIENFWISGQPNPITRPALEFLDTYRQIVILLPNEQRNDYQWPHFPKYLMDTYLCGILTSLGYGNGEMRDILEALNYAGPGNGNGNAAQAIITVGRSFGLHFGFLNANYYPTQLFNDFFLTNASLEEWINNYVE